MDSRRQMKLVSVIREAFTDILARDGKNIYGKSFVTVTNVKITSDLSLVRFYISIFNAENPEEVIHQFNEQKTDLKRKLAEKVRHQLRIMPNIEFFRDETLEYASHMDEVFKKIKEEDKRIVELGMQNDEPKEKSSPVKKAAKPTVKKSSSTKSK
ncbi:MAG: 30S ribosome-binding factor RbfA [Bacteroidetes bacterium]|nr:30S ribosome-binding factor RbfA [Bacteroidota bacterium]